MILFKGVNTFSPHAVITFIVGWLPTTSFVLWPCGMLDFGFFCVFCSFNIYFVVGFESITHKNPWKEARHEFPQGKKHRIRL